MAQAFPVPALRKEREERGTHFIADAGDIKSLGQPPSRVTVIRFEEKLKRWASPPVVNNLNTLPIYLDGGPSS